MILLEKLKNLLSGKNRVENFFVETGEGNTFLVKGVRYSLADKAIFFQVDKNSMKWAEINGKHPVVLTKDESVKSSSHIS